MPVQKQICFLFWILHPTSELISLHVKSLQAHLDEPFTTCSLFVTWAIFSKLQWSKISTNSFFTWNYISNDLCMYFSQKAPYRLSTEQCWVFSICDLDLLDRMCSSLRFLVCYWTVHGMQTLLSSNSPHDFLTIHCFAGHLYEYIFFAKTFWNVSTYVQ